MLAGAPLGLREAGGRLVAERLREGEPASTQVLDQALRMLAGTDDRPEPQLAAERTRGARCHVARWLWWAAWLSADPDAALAYAEQCEARRRTMTGGARSLPVSPRPSARRRLTARCWAHNPRLQSAACTSSCRRPRSNQRARMQASGREAAHRKVPGRRCCVG